MKTLLIISTILVTTLAKPNGFYHQEYNYKTSSSSYKNHELQHRNDDEGYYAKDGDLEGRLQPRVNAHSQHSEYVNPKLQHGYRIGTDRTESFGQLHAQDRFRMANGHMGPEMGGIMGGYIEPHRNYGVNSELRQVTANLEQEMQRELQRAVYDHYQRAAAYGQTITQAQIEEDRRILEEELRRNMTMRIQDALKMHYGNQGIRGSYSYSIINGRLQPTANYDNQELADLTRQMEANLLRHLNQQVQTYYRVDTQVHTTKNTYRVNGVSDNYPSNLQQRPVYHQYPQPVHQPMHQPVHQPMQPQPVIIHPQPHPVAPIPDSITTVATRVQTELNEILNKILEDTQRRYFAENSYHSGVDYDRVLLQLQDELRANITFHFDDQIKRAYGYTNYASKYSVEDIENLRRQIETNLITKLNRDFNRQREKFFQTHRMFVVNQPIPVQQPVSIRPIPANHAYYPVANNMNYQHNIEEMQRQLQEQLSRQLQLALMRHSYRQAHMYSGAQTNPEANYQATLNVLSDELNRNLTRQMEMLNSQQYQSGAYASQLANMRNQLQHDLMRQLQQGLQQSYSQHSSWSSSSSSSSRNTANYRPVRGYDPNVYRINGASVDPMGEDCMMGDDPSVYQQQTNSDEDLTQQTENLAEDLTQQTEDNDDLTQQIQTHDDLTQQVQSHDDLTQQVQSHDDLTQQVQTHDDLTQQVQSHDDLSQQLQTHDDLTQQVQSHDDLTQQVQTNDDLIQPAQRDDLRQQVQIISNLKPQEVPAQVPSYQQNQNVRDITRPGRIQNEPDSYVPQVNDWTQQTRDMTQSIPDENLLHSVPIYERPIEPQNVNPLYSKPREEVTVMYPSRPAPSRYQTLDPPTHSQPMLNQPYSNTYRHHQPRYHQMQSQPVQQYTSVYQWKPQRYPTGPRVSQAVQYYENLQSRPRVNPVPPQQTQYFVPQQSQSFLGQQTTFDDSTQQLEPQNQNTEFPPLHLGSGTTRDKYRINPKPVVAPNQVMPLGQQSLDDDDLTQQSQVLVDEDLTQQTQDLTQQSQDARYVPLQIGSNSQVRENYRVYPKPTSQVVPVGQQTLDDNDLTQQSQALVDEDLTQQTQDLTQQSQDARYVPLQIGSNSQVRENYRVYPKPTSQVVPVGQQTLDDDDLTQQSQALVDEDLTQQTQDLTQQSQDLTQQTQDLLSENQYLNQQSQDLTQQTQTLLPGNQHLGQQSQHLTHQTEDLSQQQSQDLTQQTQNLSPENQYQDLTQQTEDLTQQSQDLTQQSQNLALENQYLSQQSEDLTQQTEDLTQQSEDLTQQSQDLTPQSQNLNELHTNQISRDQQIEDLTQQEINPNQVNEGSSSNQQNVESNRRLTEAQRESQRLIDLLRNHQNQMEYSPKPVYQQNNDNQYVQEPIKPMIYEPKPVYTDIYGQEVQVGLTRELPYAENTQPMRYHPKPVYANRDNQQVQVGTTRQLPRGKTLISEEPKVNYAEETIDSEDIITVKNLQPIEPQKAHEVEVVTDKNSEEIEVTTKKPKWWTRWGQSIRNKLG